MASSHKDRAKFVLRIIGTGAGMMSRFFRRVYHHPDIQLIRNELIKWIIITREPGHVSIGQSVSFGKNVVIKVNKGGTLIIGRGTFIRDSSDILVMDGGRLQVGDACVIGVRCLMRCRKLVEISNDVRIGPDCKVIDHIHSPNLNGRTLDVYWSKPIRIGEGVGIFSNVFIGMGTDIGMNSKISLNSVVKGKIPAQCLAGGSPATVTYQKKTQKADNGAQ